MRDDQSYLFAPTKTVQRNFMYMIQIKSADRPTDGDGVFDETSEAV